MSGEPPRVGADIRPSPFPALSWADGARRDSAERLVVHVLGEMQVALGWYARAKRPKQWTAITLRWVILGATATAGVLPMLSEMGVGQLSPGWASIALGVAASAGGVDRYFGFSSGWMRYVNALLKVQALERRFALQAERERVRWGQEGPDVDQSQAMVELAQNALAELSTLVQDETNLWMQEFRDTMNQLAEATRTARADTQPGGATVRVSNGADVADGWVLQVDEGAGVRVRGGVTTVRPLSPGIHRFVVTARVGERDVRGESLATVYGGQVTSVDLLLE